MRLQWVREDGQEAEEEPGEFHCAGLRVALEDVGRHLVAVRGIGKNRGRGKGNARESVGADDDVVDRSPRCVFDFVADGEYVLVARETEDEDGQPPAELQRVSDGEGLKCCSATRQSRAFAAGLKEAAGADREEDDEGRRPCSDAHRGNRRVGETAQVPEAGQGPRDGEADGHGVPPLDLPGAEEAGRVGREVPHNDQVRGADAEALDHHRAVDEPSPSRRDRVGDGVERARSPPNLPRHTLQEVAAEGGRAAEKPEQRQAEQIPSVRQRVRDREHPRATQERVREDEDTRLRARKADAGVLLRGLELRGLVLLAGLEVPGANNEVLVLAVGQVGVGHERAHLLQPPTWCVAIPDSE
mmetsp:Transcript_39934/g.112883  ORF Transcript_39934/g.112883 Transcript_39934/m.112883 type:complete len:357 (-) Transcript_39934:71-1141(-)